MVRSIASRITGTRIVRIALWGVLDHALVSITNLVTTILVARALSPSDFGVFALLLAALFLAGNVQAGLITRPHNVLGATRSGHEYRRYTASTAVGQVAFTGASTLIALFGALAVWIVAPEASPFVAAFVPYLVAWQLQEFVRRVFYTEGRIGAALLNDVLSYGGQALAIFALAAAGSLTAPAALYVMAATSAAAALLGAIQLRHSLAATPLASLVRENWTYGKWLAGAEAAHWFSSGIFLYLAAAMLGPTAAAILRATEVLFGPLRVLLQFLYSVVPRDLARTLADRGRAALHARVRVTYLATVPALFAYCVAVGLLARPLLELAYGDKYVDAAFVLVLMAIRYFFGLLVPVVTSVLQAQRLTREVFRSRAYPTVLALPCGVLLIAVLGVEGAVLGMIVTAVLMNWYCWSAYRRHLDRTPSPERAAA